MVDTVDIEHNVTIWNVFKQPKLQIQGYNLFQIVYCMSFSWSVGVKYFISIAVLSKHVAQ